MSDDLTQTQEWIVDLAESNPEMSNADIAEETGTHTAVVRDVLDDYNSEDDDESSGSSSDGPTTVVDNITGTRAAVLQRAASDPDLTNREIADAVGTHTALVRDLRNSVQTESLEELLRNPALSNAEIAARTGTHTALVRDLRSDIRTTILEHSLRNPEMSNAELAEELDTHTAVVRDVRQAYEDDIEQVDITESESAAAEAPSADASAAETAAAGGDGLSSEKIVALVVGLLVLIVIAALAL
jgi:predicted HTH transcriptional regulator